MYRTGHYGVALLTYVPLGTAVAGAGHGGAAIVGGAVTVALATVPDLDHRVPLIEHRGPTHTLAFALLVGVALAGVAATAAGEPLTLSGGGPIPFAFVVGTLSVCSHLLADALTPAGIRPFWPLSDRRYSLNIVRAASPLANYLLFALGIGVALAAATGSGVGP